MLDIKVIKNESDFSSTLTEEKFADFLFKHLVPFGDEKNAIKKCIDYAFARNGGQGGFLLAAFYNDELAGELIMNKTGMSEYIPENILVYIAVDSKFRNKGIGRQIIEKALTLTEGSIALHVEYENPAKRLYERLGFTSKYAEMRLSR